MVQEIDEDLLKKAAVLMGPGSNFDKALSIAEEYRTAGLTPLFFIDENETMIYVTTEEKINGKYN